MSQEADELMKKVLDGKPLLEVFPMDGSSTSCPRCDLEFKSLLHLFCQHKDCPPREFKKQRDEQRDKENPQRRQRRSPEEVEAQMVPAIVKAIYPVLISVEQQSIQIRAANHKRVTELATELWRSFAKAS
jgi:hypothetical protein